MPKSKGGATAITTSPLKSQVPTDQSALPISQYLLGAKHAAAHLNKVIKAIENSLKRYTISQVVASAKFNEEYIVMDKGYLQEICIYISADINEETYEYMLQEIGQHCDPFPFTIFMPSGRICSNRDSQWHIPVLIPRDDIMSHKDSLAIPCSDQGNTGPSQPTQRETLAPIGAGANDQGGSSRQTYGRHLEPDGNNNGNNSGSSAATSTQLPLPDISTHQELLVQKNKTTNLRVCEGGQPPPDPDDGTLSGDPKIDFSAVIYIYRGPKPGSEVEECVKLQRTLGITGTFIAERKSKGNGTHQIVEFSQLGCQNMKQGSCDKDGIPTQEKINDQARFELFHSKVEIDTQCEDAIYRPGEPQTTPSKRKEQKEVLGNKSIRQTSGKLEVNVSPSPVKVAHDRMFADETESSIESTALTYRILHQGHAGRAVWDYWIKDANFKQTGKDLMPSELPKADFELLKIRNEHISIKVLAFWSIIQPGERPKNGQLSNIVQLVSIKAPHTVKKWYTLIAPPHTLGSMKWCSGEATWSMDEEHSMQDGTPTIETLMKLKKGLTSDGIAL